MAGQHRFINFERKSNFLKPSFSSVAMPEKVFQQTVYDLARLLGWIAYHTFDSRRSASGFPDLILIRPPRLVVVETKRQGKHPTERQREWLDLFAACGVEAYCWVLSDWPEIERVLMGERP